MKRLVLILGSTVMLCTAGLAAQQAQVNGVKVWDSEFKVIAEIRQPLALREFERHWHNKVPTSESTATVGPSASHLKLDVDAVSGGGRWLYEPDGRVWLLNVKTKRVYKIQDTAAFNSLLSIQGK